MITRLDITKINQNTWDSLVPKSKPIFYTFSWHKLWFEMLAKTFTPLYLLINDETIAPFIQKDGIVYFSGGEEIADYLDLVGTNESISKNWPEIISFLKTHNIQKIILKNIPQDSQTYAFFSQQNDLNLKTLYQQEDTTPIINLPISWEHYLNMLPRKYRHELRRKIRKFENQFPLAQIKIVDNSSSEMEVVLALMRKNEEKNIFLSPQITHFFTALPTHFPNLIELVILYVNGVPAATIIGIKNNDEILLYNSGFAEENFSGAGLYLVIKYIQRAIEKGYKRFNFLQGNERYKYELGGKDFYIYTLSSTL